MAHREFKMRLRFRRIGAVHCGVEREARYPRLCLDGPYVEPKLAQPLGEVRKEPASPMPSRWGQVDVTMAIARRHRKERGGRDSGNLLLEQAAWTHQMKTTSARSRWRPRAARRHAENVHEPKQKPDGIDFL